MFNDEFRQFLNKSTLTVAGLLTGAGLTLLLTQYPGVMELHINSEGSSIRVNGSPECEAAAEPVKN